MLKGIWEILSPDIKNIINEAGFQTFFQALLNQETHEYKDLQLLLALSERFWDTTCTFHFPGIGEVMLTTYNFFVITGLGLGGERIKINDSFNPKQIKSLLGIVPSKLKSKNVSLMWLYENIENCKTIATNTRMFMLLLIGTFLCLDLGSTVSLRYLRSLKDIDQIKNYDQGGMAYAILLHFMCHNPNLYFKIQSDRHVNIKFTSILTRTNLNRSCLSKIVS